MDVKFFSLTLTTLLAACVATAEPATMPAGAVVLEGEAIKTLTRQCSRPSPEAFDATWRPTAADIAALEAALSTALAANDRSGWARAPDGWRRQYVGLVRKGVRTIYGNFVPAVVAQHGAWRRQPVMVCDGGARFFGVEYDPARRRFIAIAYNGSY